MHPNVITYIHHLVFIVIKREVQIEIKFEFQKVCQITSKNCKFFVTHFGRKKNEKNG